MEDFTNQDWDLQAILRGYSDDNSADMSSSFDPLIANPDDQNDNFGFDFAHLFEANTSTLSDEFDQLYERFNYPLVFDDSFSSQATAISNNSVSSNSFTHEMKIKTEAVNLQKSTVKRSSSSTIHAVKYKKRKNQNKRVVLQPEGQPADNWAWRKYGQKPIKGSPYPRSYYKCSTSKGCLARKQVEQSCTDPGMFKISYSAEHNHSQPTRRNSLAGTSRHKFPIQRTSSSSSSSTESSVATPKDSAGGSPTTPLMPTNIIDEGTIIQQHIKNEAEGKIGNENECIFFDQDMALNDDFFVGLEDLINESAFYNLLQTV